MCQGTEREGPVQRGTFSGGSELQRASCMPTSSFSRLYLVRPCSPCREHMRPSYGISYEPHYSLHNDTTMRPLSLDPTRSSLARPGGGGDEKRGPSHIACWVPEEIPRGPSHPSPPASGPDQIICLSPFPLWSVHVRAYVYVRSRYGRSTEK